MNTYKRDRRRHSPQGQRSTTGKSPSCTQAQHGAVSGRNRDEVDRPFPNKPVCHRRPLNPETQASLDLCDFEKITIAEEPRGSLSTQEQPSRGTRETIAPQHPRIDSQTLSKGELQMSREIQAKKLVLQEKLSRVEEKIRQKIQRQTADVATGDDQKSDTKTRPSEQQRREPVRDREMIIQEKRQENVKQLRKREDQRTADKMKDAQEEERWKRRETETAKLRKKGHRGTHEITVHGKEVSEELNKSKWGNVKEHTRKGGEKDVWQETCVKAKEKEQNTTSAGDEGWTREKKYGDRMCKEMHSSEDEGDMLRINQQKMSHRTAAESQRGAGRNQSGEPQIPAAFNPSYSDRAEQDELRLSESADISLQLRPCKICNRKFASGRLELHVQICKKVKQSHRQVFNSYASRIKGSATEEFLKNHTRSLTPEVLRKKKQKQNHKANTRNLKEDRLPAGTSQSKRAK